MKQNIIWSTIRSTLAPQHSMMRYLRAGGRVGDVGDRITRVLRNDQVEIHSRDERDEGNQPPDHSPAATRSVRHLREDGRVALVHAARNEVVPDVVHGEEAAHDAEEECHVLQRVKGRPNVERQQARQQQDEAEVEDPQVSVVRVEDEYEQEEDEDARRHLGRRFVGTRDGQRHAPHSRSQQQQQWSAARDGDAQLEDDDGVADDEEDGAELLVVAAVERPVDAHGGESRNEVTLGCGADEMVDYGTWRLAEKAREPICEKAVQRWMDFTIGSAAINICVCLPPRTSRSGRRQFLIFKFDCQAQHGVRLNQSGKFLFYVES
ncbi:unnamed protein product [Phytophthora fragariaefolia]|uniref:Unnamed protein product n=1 Tax=Phytophthora fragariaefolia TaxID=1490495 RepID=A0A9W6U720_9STRA|nr:unnamed protein product [Phytophthora fragariaefolia]